ncbi:MAG: oxygenase MpaB family protein, partial [Pseudomonadota bacterium]
MTPRLIDTDRYFGWTVDFTKPVGEPAFSSPESVAWRVFKNIVVLAIGGICAVTLEFADARIRSGVWDHSTFKSDPVGRSKRTGLAAMIGVYGPQSVARRIIQGVTNLHANVEGETPAGEAYKALDPDLMDWVSATAHYGFLTAYHRYAEPLSDAEQMRYFRDGGDVAALYGVRQPLRSWADFDTQLQARLDRFEPHPI